ncbi:MAG: hypothetical protein PVH04_12965, partial [Gammaproteobacteria bacterium]
MKISIEKNKPYFILLAVVFGIIILSAAIAETVSIKFVTLWTDILLYVLVIAVVLFGIQARRKEHLRAPWRHVLQRPLAMSALVVLAFYVAVGLLDSIHFRESLDQQEGQTEIHYSGEVVSVFDKLVWSLKTQQEKTYSSPFATHLYAKETIDTPEGQIRAYPRLQYGGGHLKNPEQDFWPNVILGTALTLVYATLLWLAVGAVITWRAAVHYKVSFG